MIAINAILRRTTALLAMGALVSGCVLRTTPSIDQMQIDQFRSDPGAVADFEAAHGSITNFALPPFIAAAARYTGLDYADVEALMQGAPSIQGTPGQSATIGAGVHRMEIVDASGAARSLGPVMIRNTSAEPVALIIESRTVSGGFANFNYVELAPGDRFTLEHNEPVSGTTIIVVAGVVVVIAVVFEGGSRLFESSFACHLVTKSFLADYCTGFCPAGTTCTATATRGYGWGGTQATTCGCI